MLKKKSLISQFPNFPISQNAFSLIETIVSIAILGFICLTLYSLFSFTLQVIWENKARVGATALANRKLEIAHNLPYDDVGTTTGIPSGSIVALENTTLNGVQYTIATDVIYIDDVFDGVQGGEPDDTLSSDYKRVRIAVSWPTKLTQVPVVFLTDIVPRGIESEAGGGTLFIQVFDAHGLAVPQADVQIVNNDLVPVVDIETVTDSQGTLSLPGASPAVESYQITVSKVGYSTAQTYDATIDNPSPTPAHLTVFEGQVTSISFFIDLVSNINIHVQDENSLGLGDLTVTVQGEKIIGTTGPVYKYSHNHNTDIDGDIALIDMEWDSYTFSVASTTGWNIADSDPFQPVNVLPNTTTDVILTLEPRDDHCLRVVVKDVEDQPLANVSVHLYNATNDEYLTTATSGQVFFTPWNQATSTIGATSTGFVNYLDELLITGYMVENVVMTEP